jgi:hypothetical protein
MGCAINVSYLRQFPALLHKSDHFIAQQLTSLHNKCGVHMVGELQYVSRDTLLHNLTGIVVDCLKPPSPVVPETVMSAYPPPFDNRYRSYSIASEHVSSTPLSNHGVTNAWIRNADGKFICYVM